MYPKNYCKPSTVGAMSQQIEINFAHDIVPDGIKSLICIRLYNEYDFIVTQCISNVNRLSYIA